MFPDHDTPLRIVPVTEQFSVYRQSTVSILFYSILIKRTNLTKGETVGRKDTTTLGLSLPHFYPHSFPHISSFLY